MERRPFSTRLSVRVFTDSGKSSSSSSSCSHGTSMLAAKSGFAIPVASVTQLWYVLGPAGEQRQGLLIHVCLQCRVAHYSANPVFTASGTHEGPSLVCNLPCYLVGQDTLNLLFVCGFEQSVARCGTSSAHAHTDTHQDQVVLTKSLSKRSSRLHRAGACILSSRNHRTVGTRASRSKT